MTQCCRFMLRGEFLSSNDNNNNNNNHNINNNNEEIYEWEMIEESRQGTSHCSEYNNRYFVLSFDINVLDGLNLDLKFAATQYHTIEQIVKYFKDEARVNLACLCFNGF